MASPAGMYYANAAGIANPFRALFERDDTLLVISDTEAEWIYYYFVENYRSDITMQKIAEIDGADGAGVWDVNAP